MRFRRFLFCVPLLFCDLLLPCSSELQAGTVLPPGAPTGKKEMRVPEDGKNWYTVVLVHAVASQDSIDKRLVESFSSDRALASLARQTRFTVLESSSKHYQQRFAEWKRLPAVIVMRGEEHDVGETVFQDSGPKCGHHLAHRIQCAIDKRCPGGHCDPLVQVEQAEVEEPTPVEPQVEESPPPIRPDPVAVVAPPPPSPPKKKLHGWIICVLTCLGYWGFCFVQDTRSQH